MLHGTSVFVYYYAMFEPISTLLHYHSPAEGGDQHASALKQGQETAISAQLNLALSVVEKAVGHRLGTAQ